MTEANVTEDYTPDFTGILVERVDVGSHSSGLLKFSFVDERLKGYYVIVAADTDAGVDNGRLTTLIARFPRSILAEMNTHRVFSRNSASSRARAVKKTIKDIMEEPYIPVWTINKTGMSGPYASPERAKRATELWLKGRDAAVGAQLSLLYGPDVFERYGDGTLESLAQNYEAVLENYYSDGYEPSGAESTEALSIHKQDSNRVIEPYMWHEAIITSSFWDNFINLRAHPEAHPAIIATAMLIQEALRVSKPKNTPYHLPFVADFLIPSPGAAWETLRPLYMHSSAEAAQVSYKDKATAEKSSATRELAERLLREGHLSPFEHSAVAASEFYNSRLDKEAFGEQYRNEDELVSNLSASWVQFRSILAGITK